MLSPWPAVRPLPTKILPTETLPRGSKETHAKASHQHCFQQHARKAAHTWARAQTHVHPKRPPRSPVRCGSSGGTYTAVGPGEKLQQLDHV